MVGISTGDFVGRDVPADTPQAEASGIVLERLNFEAGEFDLPGGAPPPNPCNRFRPDEPYDCVAFPTSDQPQAWISLHGRTLPGAYLFPAFVSRLSDTTNGKLFLGRLGFLLQNTLLVGVAAAAFRRLPCVHDPAIVATLALTVTPLVSFLSSQLAPSATEWAATAAVSSTMICALHEANARWWFTSCVISSAAFWTRDSAFIVIPIVLVAACIVERERVRRAFTQFGQLAVLAGLSVLGLGMASAALWRIRWQYPVQRGDWSLDEVVRGIRGLRELGTDSVARLGWLDVRPTFSIWKLWMTVAAVVAVLVARRCRSWAWTAGAFALLWVAYNVWLTASLAVVGFGNQARFSLALIVAAVIVAAATVQPTSPHPRELTALKCAAIAVGLSHAYVLWFNWHRHAFGASAPAFPRRGAAWIPPLGLLLTGGLIAAGCVATALVMWPRSIPTDVDDG